MVTSRKRFSATRPKPEGPEKPFSSRRVPVSPPSDTPSVKIGDGFDALWTALAPYLGASLGSLTTPAKGLKLPRTQHLTFLFADIRGFMAIAESQEPDVCVRILNHFFTIAVDSVHRFSGVVDKFQGDGIMAVFYEAPGVPRERRAVQCAVHLRDAIHGLAFSEIPSGRLRLGIGISSGCAAIASIGPEARRDYTVIGDTVNVAHRLQSLSRPDQILVCDATHERMGGDLRCRSLGPIKLKGRRSLVSAYSVYGAR